MRNEGSDFRIYMKKCGYIIALIHVVMFWLSAYVIVFTPVFLAIPNEYQIILGLLHPLVKELSFSQYCYFARKIGLQESSTFEITWHSHMETYHALFLSVILGNIANSETSYCILAMDFITNIVNCLRIIHRIKYKGSMHRGKYDSACKIFLQKL